MRDMHINLSIDEESILGKVAIVEKKAEELRKAAWQLREALCFSGAMNGDAEKPEA